MMILTIIIATNVSMGATEITVAPGIKIPVRIRSLILQGWINQSRLIINWHSWERQVYFEEGVDAAIAAMAIRMATMVVQQ